LAVCLVVGSLYFARSILIPLSLSILFAFLLEPLAKRFERFRLGRFGSALASVAIAMTIFGALSYFVMGQFEDLGNQWPTYEKNIHERLRHIGARHGSVFDHALKSMQDFSKDLSPTNSTSTTNTTPGTNAVPIEVKPVPVELKTPETSTFQIVRNLIGPSVDILGTLFLVIVFCIFILASRDDLRVRLSRIVGSQNVKATNELLEDTGQRVSRYLFMQLFVNACYGIPIGIGLWAVGIPNPLLWGMIAAVFRYIPYAGPWIAAAMPIAIGFAIGPGLSKPLFVFLVFAVVEIITANFIEPWLYGNTTGITPLAVLIAAVFWAWLWGPIGLLLSMPLTVCVISIARYVPQLEMLDQLFGEAKIEETGPAARVSNANRPKPQHAGN
jgi:predicted PurR-regulated permease PerM